MIRSKKGTDDFRTVVHILIGAIFFIIVAIAVMFFITGQEIKAIFESGAIEGDKIATRIIFSKNCLALSETITADWYLNTDERHESELVRLGIIDYNKWDAAKISADANPKDISNIINKCVGYTITDKYKYTLNIGPPEGSFDVEGIAGDGSVCLVGASITRKKLYPVLLYNAGNYENRVLNMTIRFCYLNETVG
ncbi:MAG: hypothetical protein JSW73_04890 [Candidatus Woesearchaeota archaeon]|nr:MAG: hypothetical protein JSW73_04890 [Candidatus Woesearchaeota archaeon]